MTSGRTSKSKLVNVGVLLILLGLLVSILGGRFLQGPTALPLALAIDCLKAGFFVGVGLLVVGLLRNKRRKNTSTQV
jgi:uncharacterized membrane protein YidH (DUF202 family)